MKTVKRNSWMVWAIAALAILNITTLITVIYQKNRVIREEAITVTDSDKTESASVLYSTRYFRDELNLTKEQMSKFSQFNPEFRQGARAINLQLTEKRIEMLNEMAETNSDTARLNALSDSIGFLHSRLKKVTYMYYLNFKSICDQEQQKKLEQLFAEMFNNDTQMLQNGRGGQGGRHFGWQNKN